MAQFRVFLKLLHVSASHVAPGHLFGGHTYWGTIVLCATSHFVHTLWKTKAGTYKGLVSLFSGKPSNRLQTHVVRTCWWSDSGIQIKRGRETEWRLGWAVAFFTRKLDLKKTKVFQKLILHNLGAFHPPSLCSLVLQPSSSVTHLPLCPLVDSPSSLTLFRDQ